ncbi:MAG: M23 family metallopeptidase [Lachnospiraceae bacterium]|nr:M23 family metallopeptidase [Lachnospiraceae bacterium]MDE6185704.1 M23 family metallopeptidase [Lachnospiraceae bacterium]MDE7285679.1 M23 family metallopeptidase [Lachnospiraceae bacterium]
MRRSRRRGLVKERVLMVASAVLVLGSLTATGIWLGRDRNTQDEGYVVDLSAIENNTAAGLNEEDSMNLAESVTQGASTQDDLDYDPYFQETNSQKVENPDQSESESMSDGTTQESADNEKKEQDTKEQGTEDASADQEENTTALSTAMQPALTFSDSDTLVWPIVGNVLVNYSMDKTVYFPTLQQYKYNPAIIIQANEGDLITAASAGKVSSVFTDPQIGNAVTMELGGGYEATYGQLTNILVSEGSYVAAGDVIAEVASPTKYFSVEGTNVYFKLTKDGEPVNPMAKLN